MGIINANIEEKIFVWTPPKTGSTRASSILSKLGFNSYETTSDGLTFRSSFEHTHECSFFKNHEYYKLLLTVRNPYEQIVSYFKASNIDNFDEYYKNGTKLPKSVKFTKENFEKYLHILVNYEITKMGEITFDKIYPDYIVRMENMYQDYLEIPFVTKTEYYQSGELYKDCNIKMNESKYEDFDFRELYDQNLADLVYYNFANFFDFGQYSKNSWKK